LDVVVDEAGSTESGRISSIAVAAVPVAAATATTDRSALLGRAARRR
jgi:hypothetical protein